MKLKGLPNPINNIWFPIPCLVGVVVIIIWILLMCAFLSEIEKVLTTFSVLNKTFSKMDLLMFILTNPYDISNILHAHCSISLLFLFLFFLGFSVCVQTGIGPQGPFFGSAKSDFPLPLDKSLDQFLSRVQKFWVLLEQSSITQNSSNYTLSKCPTHDTFLRCWKTKTLPVWKFQLNNPVTLLEMLFDITLVITTKLWTLE